MRGTTVDETELLVLYSLMKNTSGSAAVHFAMVYPLNDNRIWLCKKKNSKSTHDSCEMRTETSRGWNCP
jgi:hypothetical protein